jgi:Na+-transporting NADH:ubiquinone oxidoreductase subunit NqrC
MSTQTLTILLSLLSLVGVVIGAGLHYVFAKSGERQKHLDALRSQAYVDYMRCVAQLARVDRSDIKKFAAR